MMKRMKSTKRHFLVKVLETLETTFEVWADDEDQAALVAAKGPGEACVEHESESFPPEVVDIALVEWRVYEC